LPKGRLKQNLKISMQFFVNKSSTPSLTGAGLDKSRVFSRVLQSSAVEIVWINFCRKIVKFWKAPRKLYAQKTAALLVVILLTAAVFVYLAPSVQAQASLGLESIEGTGLGTVDLKVLIMRVIQILLGFLGLVAVIIIIYGGYIYLTSEGEQEKISKAKSILLNAVIGLVIILSAFGIVTYVINKFNEVMFGAGGDGQAISVGFDISGNALGGGILNSVYPEPGAHEIPRNTLIMVGFKEELDTETVIVNPYGQVPPECAGLAIACGYLAGTAPDNPFVSILNLSDQTALETEQVVAMSPDNKNFVFDPYGQNEFLHLGDATGPTGYAVTLTENIDKANGQPAFLLGGYTWYFEVSNFLDLTPPQVAEVIPLGNDVYMNAVVQIDFSEAVNAAATIGLAEVDGNGQFIPDTFTNLRVAYQDGGLTKYVGGEFVISNQFRTVTFVANTPCLDDFNQPIQNSCGEEVYCLPPAASLHVTAVAAEVDPYNPLSGVSDAAGNSLDGGGELGADVNGTPEGPPADNYFWNFQTNAEMWLEPPYVTEPLEPADDEALVPLNRQVKAPFNSKLMSSSLNSENAAIFKQVCSGGQEFPSDPACYPAAGFIVYKENVPAENRDQAVIRTYAPYLDPLTTYNPRLTSGIRDIYQNCFYPACGPGSGGDCP